VIQRSSENKLRSSIVEATLSAAIERRGNTNIDRNDVSK
jgi:hypothetical protein